MRRIAMMSAAAIAMMAVGAAQAAPTLLLATQNPAVQSSFTLDFGDADIGEGPIGQRTALIASTSMGLELDGTSARFSHYTQQVESLTLPGGIETGDLTITVLDGTSSGTFNSATGEFSTTEIYRIFFTADLSGIGFPGNYVDFPSASSGVVTFDAGSVTSGSIGMNWTGSSELAGLPFDYTCAVDTLFEAVPEPGALALLSAGAIALIRRSRRQRTQ